MNAVAIVGGGITGLAAAWELQQRGVDYLLLEAGPRLGGKIVTERPEGFIIDGAADSFLSHKPWAWQLCQESGLAHRLIGTNQQQRTVYLWRHGRLQPMPRGLRLLAPLDAAGLAESSLLSPSAKRRMLAEPTVPRRTSDDDESLAAFVTRRFGREALEVFGEPLLAGIYVGRPARQSMQATFPQLVALERRYGSVTTGLRQPTATPPPPAELPAGLFLSLAGGLGELIDHLASRLTGPVRLNQPVVALEPDRRLRLASGECLRPDAILLTTPPAVAGRLLAGIRPDLAATLARLPTVSSGTISLGFRAAAIDHPLDGYGFLVPRREPTRLLASTWSSTKLPGRAPTGHVLLRLFVGGHRHAADLRLPDDQLLALARTELARIMGITAQPVVSRIFRWRQANPQYELGHLATMAGLRQQTPPWLALAGCAYEGIGIPDCIRQGRTAAAQLLI